MNWWKVIIEKFVGGVMCITAGLSLGREGPSVQLGAAVGQGFSRIFKRIKIEEKYLVTGGASAGLSAAFNAPLAGVIFALEEVHKSFSPQYINNFIILGMAGYFSAIVRGPITGSVLITEMTGSFNHLLSLALVSIIAYIVADLMGSKPIYESLLERILINNSYRKSPEDGTTKTILEVVVYHGSYLEGKKIRELSLPENCLLVAIKRGKDEIIPKGNTNIYAGDYLVVLTNEHSEINIRENLLKMAQSSLVISHD